MSSFHTHKLIRIAIADDHKSFLAGLCRIINEWDDCKVIFTATSGEQFIAQIDPHNPPDLALIDIRMNGINGYDITRILKRKFPEIKIIVISMYESRECLMELLKVGADGFISKTADEWEIKKAVHEMMRIGYFFADQSIARIFRQVVETGNYSLIKGLTKEEATFLKFNYTEKTIKKIALKMKKTERHIEYIRDKLFEKFGVESRMALALFALECGLTV
jgi:DNA-binding NarL/FixJ family response regulator